MGEKTIILQHKSNLLPSEAGIKPQPVIHSCMTLICVN